MFTPQAYTIAANFRNKNFNAQDIACYLFAFFCFNSFVKLSISLLSGSAKR